VRAVLDKLDGDLAAAKKKTEGGIGQIVGNVQKLGGMALAGIGIAAGAVAGAAVVAFKALSGMVNEAAEAEVVQAQLNAVLASTGGVAGITAERANELADSLSKITRFDDEAIISGESLLLTFTNIGQNVFPAATQTMLDMSTVLGQDLESSARMLGRALNDPVQGMSALTRVGITFSEEQKKTIQALTEAGQLEEAQGIILDALAVKFGGAAAAAGQTFAGQMDILKNRMANVREEIGGALLPVAGKLMDWFGQAVDAVLPIIIPLFERLTTVISDVSVAIEPLVQGFIAALGGDTQALVEGFYQAVTNLFGAETTAKIQTFIGGIMGVVDAVRPWIQQAVAWIGQNVELKDVLIALGIAIAAVVLPALYSIITAAAPVIAVGLALIAAVVLIRKAWESDFLGIRTFILETLTTIRTWWAEHGEQVLAKAQEIWQGVMAVVQWFVGVFMDVYNAWKAAFTGDWYSFGENVRAAWDKVWEMIKGIGSAAWQAIKNFFQNTDWGAVGKAIIEGVARGITAAVGWLKDAARRAAQAALDAAKGFLGIHSPSAAFELIGRQSIEGWARGLSDVVSLEAAVSLGAAGSLSAAGGQTVQFYGPVTIPGVQNGPGLLQQLAAMG